MQGPLPESTRPHIRLVLDALLALWPGLWPRAAGATGDVAAAGVMRELREVGKVTSTATGWSCAPTKTSRQARWFVLPLIHAGECHTTGWLSRLAPARPQLSKPSGRDLQHLVTSGRSEAVRCMPGKIGPAIRRGAACAWPAESAAQYGGCQACGLDEMVAVFRTTGTRSRTRGKSP